MNERAAECTMSVTCSATRSRHRVEPEVRLLDVGRQGDQPVRVRVFVPEQARHGGAQTRLGVLPRRARTVVKTGRSVRSRYRARTSMPALRLSSVPPGS